VAPIEATFVLPEAEDVSQFEALGTVRDRLSPGEMAQAYAQTDVVIKHSFVEGMYGPPLEGFHKGATCLTTPVTGHDEYVEHGWNGIVYEWDDYGGAARQLDLLAQDRRYLHFLRRNALLTAKSWPSWDQAGEMMAIALKRIAASEVDRDVSISSLARSTREAIDAWNRYHGAIGLEGEYPPHDEWLREAREENRQLREQLQAWPVRIAKKLKRKIKSRMSS
jgi:hypothetical protein